MQQDVSHHSIYFALHKRCNQSAIICCNGFKITKNLYGNHAVKIKIVPAQAVSTVYPVITELSLQVLAQALMM